MPTVGKQVRELRETRGWTQAQLGVYAGISPSTVNLIEHGHRNPNAITLQKLADALKVQPGDLFAGTEGPKAEASSGSPSPKTTEAGRAQEQDSMAKLYRMSWRDTLNALAERWEGRVEDGLFTLDAADEFFLTLVDIAPSVSDAIKIEQQESIAFIDGAIQRVSTRGTAAHLEEMQSTGVKSAAERLLNTANAVFVAARRSFEGDALEEVEQHYKEAREALLAA